MLGFLEQLLEMVTPYFMEVLSLAITVVIVPHLRRTLKEWGIKAFIESEKEIVMDTVLYVEKMYKNLNGPAKWGRAKMQIVKKANKYKLQIDEEDIDELITVFTQSFNFDWDKK